MTNDELIHKRDKSNETEQSHESPQKSEREALAAIRSDAKFHLGCVVATPAALELMHEKGTTPNTLLARHANGDWGDVFADDRKLNELALHDGSRIFSVYRLVASELLAEVPPSKRHELPTIWIITNAANVAGVRDVTTLLLPEDY